MSKSYFDQFFEKVEKGQKGEIIWIPSPYKRWKNRIGISKRFYTLIGGDSGCLGKGTPILMYDGSIKAVEDVEIGDRLMGPDSNPRTVESLKRGEEEMYWIRQNSAMDYKVNKSHILSIKRKKRKYSKKVIPDQLDIPKDKRKRNYELKKKWTKLNNIEVSDYLEQSKTFKRQNKGWRPKEIKFSNQNVLPLDPYMLGIWLGDGSSYKPQITINDKEVINYIYKFADENNLQVNNREDDYYISRGYIGGKKTPGSLRCFLKNYNLLNNKHIPHDYKTSTIKNRLSLLAGLMDSDGNLSNGCFYIISKWKHLAEEINYVALSCGFNSTVNNKKVNDSTYYRISICGKISKIPTKIERKQSNKDTTPSGVGRTGFTVEEDKIDKYYGFTLKEDPLFCLGDFTVTHNSGKSAFLDSTYILHTYRWYKENEDQLSFHPKIILRSMERSKEYRIAKWVCQRMFEKYNILIDVKTIFGMHAGDSRIDDNVKKKIESCRKYIEDMQDYVTVIDGRSTPTGVFKDFRDYALKNGDLYHHTREGKLKMANYNPSSRKIGWKTIPDDQYPDDRKPFPERFEKVYIPDDKNEIVIPVVDHIQKYVNRSGWNSKQTLDKATEYSADLRDLYGMSPINISQFNRNKSDSKRRFSKSATFKPEENDFKGSGDMYEDCDVCIGLFNPHEYGISKHQGYNINSMVNSQGYNRFRSAHVLKNTYGPDNFGAGFHFIGEIGQYRLLPKPDNLDSYRKYAKIEKANNIIDIVQR